ncbi:MAG: hypothetical protein HRT68_09765 [Flavobacteriaceae bacterium]|nr:hypothetical protein [Flavobacteriaceae bacterium]
MKRIALLMLFTSTLVSAQSKIETIQTCKEAAQFLKEHINRKYTFLYLFNREEHEDAIQTDDLDRNGKTDLIIEAQDEPYHMVILDLGNEVYKKLEFVEKQDFFNTASLKEITTINHEKLLIYETPIYMSDLEFIPDKSAIIAKKEIATDSITLVKKDSLVVKYGELIQYNAKRTLPKKINKIELTFANCYWYCPAYKISITNDLKIQYSNLSKGIQETFQSQVNRFAFLNLETIASYLEVEKLPHIQSILINDGQDIYIDIIYKNGDSLRLKNQSGQIKQQEFYPLYAKLVELKTQLFAKNNKEVPNHHEIYMDRASY